MLLNIRSFSQAVMVFTKEQKFDAVKFWHESRSYVTACSICSMFNVRSKDGPKYFEIMRIVKYFEG